MSVINIESIHLPGREYNTPLRIRRQKKVANAILSRTIETPTFSDLEVISRKLRSADDETRDHLRDTVDSIAVDLKQKLESKIETTHNDKIATLDQVWKSVDAWEDCKTPETRSLVVFTLNHFPGVGQVHLAEAFNLAEATGKTFNEALDEINHIAV